MPSPNPSREGARQSPTPTLDRTLRRVRDVCAATGLSRSGIYRLIREGSFPAPVPLTAHVSAFSAIEVQAWIDARIAERDAALAAALPEQKQGGRDHV